MANKRVTDLDPIATAPTTGVMHFVDTTDSTQNAAGSSFKVTKEDFLKENTAAILLNTAKTGISTEQSTAITDNTSGILLKANANEVVDLATNQIISGFKSFKGTVNSDSVILGVEVVTTSTTSSATNWTGTNLLVGYTHAAGATTQLNFTINIVIGSDYYLSYSINGRTAGNVVIDFGGSNSGNVSTSGVLIAPIVNNALLQLFPSSDFNGAISFSIKKYSSSNSITTFLNSFGIISNELRASNIVSNFFQGILSGAKNITGTENTFIGQNSGIQNSTGSKNTFVGNQSGFKNSKGQFNTLIGYQSGLNNTTGSFNVFIGEGVANGNISGGSNVAIGQGSLNSNQFSSSNTAIGINAGNKNTASSNVFIGSGSGGSNTTGANNVFLGDAAGIQTAALASLNISNNSVFLGKSTKALADNQTNQLVVGFESIGLGSNTSVFGNLNTVFGRFWGRFLSGTSVDNGVDQGQFVGSVVCTTLKTSGFTVATLPAPPAQGLGARAHVTDALNPTYLETLTGGGTVKCPVFYNGTAWVAA